MQRKILPLLLFSLLALTGCSCQQRLERLQHRCPDCFTQTTAHVRDTVPVPEKILSGSVSWAWLPSGDTVLLQNRDITLQLLLEGDSRLSRLHLDVAIAAAMVALLAIWGIAREVRLARNRKSN